MGKSTFVLHGIAPTSVVNYTDFTGMYPGNVMEFKPDYGGAPPIGAEDKQIRFFVRNTKWPNLIILGRQDAKRALLGARYNLVVLHRTNCWRPSTTFYSPP